MKRTKEEAALTREALLKAALTIFGKKGYSRTSLVDVAREAGLTRGAVYWHFGSKYELFKAILDEVYTGIEKMTVSVLQMEISPLEKIRLLVRNIIMKIGERREYKAIDEVMLFHSFGNPDLEKLYNYHMSFEKKKRKELVEVLLDAAQKEGMLDTRYSPRMIATALHAYVSGIVNACLYDDSQLSLEERAEAMADMFVYGIAGRN